MHMGVTSMHTHPVLIVRLVRCHIVEARVRGVAPWFVKKLPSRVEILEGQSLAMLCSLGGRGCKPWFIKKLPSRVELFKGQNLETKCRLEECSDDVLSQIDGETNSEYKMRTKKERPMPPASIQVTLLSANSVNIEWETPHDDGGSPVTHYFLEKKEAGGEWEVLTTLPPSADECELENMAADKEYHVRICAANKVGVSDPREVAQPIKVKGVVKDVPSIPGTPQVLETGDNLITITWDLPFSDGGCPILHYILERREIRGPRWIRVHKSSVTGPPHTIQNLTESSQYEFRVYARNATGIGKGSDMSKPVVCQQQGVEPPQFVGEMADLTVEEGERGVFECRVTGHPLPEVKWYTNYRQVSDGYKFKVHQDGGRCSLAVSNLQTEDCGQVECRAFNKAGSARIHANLCLKVPAKLRLSPVYRDGVNCSRGQDLRVRLPVQGRPAPRLTWAKDGEVLESSAKFEITEDTDSATLVVHDTEKSDTGQYTIKVENDLNKDERNFSVTVTDRPDPPAGRPTLSEVTKDNVLITWQVPPHDGGGVIAAYRLERREGATGTWQACGSTQRTHLRVRGLTEGCKYSFRVAAENCYGVSDCGEESDSVITKEPKVTIDYDKLVVLDSSSNKVNTDKLKSDINSKYMICEEIGRGAYGVVHRALERGTGRNWAAKLVRGGTLERLMVNQEMELMNDLHHPKLLQLHDAYSINNDQVLILEFVSGVDLLQRLVDVDYAFTEEDCINYMRQVCQGVAHMHKNNIIHLDLKPENVLCHSSNSKEIKVIDFGLAQRVDPDHTAKVAFSTPEYCAPEVVTFDPVSFASDMWSLGVFAYVLLTGISPFLGKTPRDTFHAISEKPLTFDGPEWRHISQAARDWIRRLLNRDYTERMTINQALAHPWLNGDAEAKLKRITLPTDNHRNLILSQAWREKFEDEVALGRLAHHSPVFGRLLGHSMLDREITMVIPDHEPEVVIELGSTESYEGTTGHFKCKFQGKPEPFVKWFHEGQSLPDDDPKYDIWYKRGLAMLNINEVGCEDAGQYVCVAANNVGTCTTMGELHVHELGWRRKSIDTGKVHLRRRSLSFERESWSLDRSRSMSVERRSMDRHSVDRQSVDRHSVDRHSVERQSATGTVSGSGSNGLAASSGYGTILPPALPDSPPLFKLSPIDQFIPVGQPCCMSVLITGEPGPDVAWFRGEQRISACDQYAMESERGFYKLFISAVLPQDSAEWRCLAINSYGQAIASCKLLVLEDIPADSSQPKYTGELRKTITPEGGATRLQCQVAGQPEPKVLWYKDREPLADSAHYQYAYDRASEQHALCIGQTFPEDGGYYGCQALNVAGSAFTETRLLVERLDYDSIYSQRSSRGSEASGDHESGRTQASMASAKKKRFDASPQFMTKLRGKKCQEGTTVKFNCSVSGLPLPDVMWFKNNTKVSDDSRHKMTNNYGLLSLEITNTQRDDSALYTVKATNPDGEITCSAPLDVQEIHLEEIHSVKRRPYFLSEALNTWAEVGQKAVFEAQATGRPMPSFKWQRDNITVNEDARCRIFSDESGNTKLVIKEVTHGDAGLYFCAAENKEGRTKCTATLRVVDKGAPMETEPARRRRSLSQEPMLRSTREGTPLFEIPAPVGTKPWFVKPPPSEVTAYEGDPITIRCILDGDPKPKVTWNKGARELIYTKRHRVVHEDNHYMMQIKSAIQTDPGEYTVTAENACGRIKATTWVNMKPRPVEEDEPALRRSRFDLPDYEYNVLTETDLLKMAPRFTKKLPREREVSEGSSVEVACKIQEGEPLEYLSGIKISRKVVEKAPLPNDADMNVIDVTAVQEGEAPTMLSSLSDKSGKPGGIIKLTIKLNKCQPTATVIWFKDGKDITDDDRFEIFADGDTYNCEICDTEADDSGSYSVTATNSIGTASCFCTVTVKCVEDSVPAIVVDLAPPQEADSDEEPEAAEVESTPAVESTTEIRVVSSEVAEKVEVIAEKIAEDIVVEAVQEAPFREKELEALTRVEVTEESVKAEVLEEAFAAVETPTEAPQKEPTTAGKKAADEESEEESEEEEDEMEESEEAAITIGADVSEEAAASFTVETLKEEAQKEDVISVEVEETAASFTVETVKEEATKADEISIEVEETAAIFTVETVKEEATKADEISIEVEETAASFTVETVKEEARKADEISIEVEETAASFKVETVKEDAKAEDETSIEVEGAAASFTVETSGEETANAVVSSSEVDVLEETAASFTVEASQAEAVQEEQSSIQVEETAATFTVGTSKTVEEVSKDETPKEKPSTEEDSEESEEESSEEEESDEEEEEEEEESEEAAVSIAVSATEEAAASFTVETLKGESKQEEETAEAFEMSEETAGSFTVGTAQEEITMEVQSEETAASFTVGGSTESDTSTQVMSEETAASFTVGGSTESDTSMQVMSEETAASFTVGGSTESDTSTQVMSEETAASFTVGGSTESDTSMQVMSEETAASFTVGGSTESDTSMQVMSGETAASFTVGGSTESDTSMQVMSGETAASFTVGGSTEFDTSMQVMSGETAASFTVGGSTESDTSMQVMSGETAATFVMGTSMEDAMKEMGFEMSEGTEASFTMGGSNESDTSMQVVSGETAATFVMGTSMEDAMKEMGFEMSEGTEASFTVGGSNESMQVMSGETASTFTVGTSQETDVNKEQGETAATFTVVSSTEETVTVGEAEETESEEESEDDEEEETSEEESGEESDD